MTTSMRSGVERGGEAVARRPEFSWLARAGIGHGTQDEDDGWARLAGVASGVAYAALCVTAVKILIGASSSGGASSPKRTTGGVLDWTGGTLIIGAVGAVLIGVALYQGYAGLSRKFSTIRTPQR